METETEPESLRRGRGGASGPRTVPGGIRVCGKQPGLGAGLPCEAGNSSQAKGRSLLQQENTKPEKGA